MILFLAIILKLTFLTAKSMTGWMRRNRTPEMPISFPVQMAPMRKYHAGNRCGLWITSIRNYNSVQNSRIYLKHKRSDPI